MKTSHLLLPIFILTIISGCKGAKTPEDIWAGKAVELSGQEIYLDPELSLSYSPVIVTKDHILGAVAYHKTHFFALSRFNKDSIIYISHILRKGRGPFEMLLSSIVTEPQDNYIFFYDNTYGVNKWIKTGTNRIEKLTDVSNWEEREIDNINNFSTLYPQNKKATSFLAARGFGQFASDSMYYKIDSAGVEPLNLPYPDDLAEENNLNAKFLAYQGKIKRHPQKNRYVYFAGNNRFMHIFDYDNDNKHIELISEPYSLYPHYVVSSPIGNIKFKKESLIGYRAFEVTSGYIYILMNDFVYIDLGSNELHNGYSVDYSNTVYVFDWDGNPVNKLVLDKYVNNIFIDPDDQYLFGRNDDDDESSIVIYRFDLNAVPLQ